jgi:hypothetical protein
VQTSRHTDGEQGYLINRLLQERKIHVKVAKYQIRGQRDSINIFTTDQSFSCTSSSLCRERYYQQNRSTKEGKIRKNFRWMFLSKNAGSYPYPSQVERCHVGLQTTDGETEESCFVKNWAYNVS